MISAVSAATTLISGMQAQGSRVQQAAGNIANQNTRDYQPARGEFVSQGQGTGGGVSYVALQASNGGVDQASEIVDMQAASTAYKAAAAAFASITETESQVLETIA